ncbi:3D domain-containing protein [Cohnella nanjingensis]|uniref:LysM peptidoglycan-binding domain-containing protein n=1 Tax=Cohnella nanjingensis TaxID=1387779 RepID=A0A7X0RR94_9BACL|nr:3D domain-containing protein [Cohnella nanjingensis]MBB6670965.1 LysM peptidoglycan-binding domain-containing protein [Cohnella nanjingensis]
MANIKKTGLRAAALALGAAVLLPAVTAFAATSYTAKEGDTFWKLSKQFNVPLEKLMSFNAGIDPLNIYGGLQLTIPAPTTGANAVNAKLTAASVSAASVSTVAGDSLSYSKVVTMKASAYSASAEENGWGPVDYFGNPLKLGTIAVDPKVIPLGTKVYITGYDFDGLPSGGMVAKATDAGSAIKGNRIDIFVPGTRAEVSKFGYQYVKLYVLK